MEGQMKNNKPKWSFSIIIIVILAISSIFLLGFKLTENKTPNEHYIVYLNGEKIQDLVIPDSVKSIGNGTFKG
jgi:hypothetical protein